MSENVKDLIESIYSLIDQFTDDLQTNLLLDFNEKSTRLSKIFQASEKQEDLNKLKNTHPFFQTMLDYKKDVQFIETGKFAWDYSKANKMNIFMKKFVKLSQPLFIKFGNFNFFKVLFPAEYFYHFLNINYGRIGGNTTYDSVFKLGSKMIKIFINCYLNQDLAFYPKIESDTCQLMDPIFRQKIRIQNQNNEKIQKKYFNEYQLDDSKTQKFNLKKFIFRCIEQFFPNVGWRWIGGQQFAHEYTLDMILLVFEYGLWKKEELNLILTKTYQISEIMYNLENFIYKDSLGGRISQAYFTNQKRQCARCRELIAKIFMHLIIFHLDIDVYEKLQHFDLNSVQNVPGLRSSDFNQSSYNKKEILDLFKDSFFSKKKLYTYFTYVLITYLARYKQTNKKKENVIMSEALQKQLTLLFTFIQDINGDFYRNSLKMINHQYFTFYYLKEKNKYQQECDLILKQCIDQQNKFKIMSQTEFEKDQNIILNQLQNLFKNLAGFITIKKTNNKQNSIQNNDSERTNLSEDDHHQKNSVNYKSIFKQEITKKLVGTLSQIPHYIVSFLDLIPKEEEIYENKNVLLRNKTLYLGIYALEKYCQYNSLAQLQIFSGQCFDHFKVLYEENINTLHWLIKRVIDHNQNLLLMEENTQLFDMIMDNYRIIYEQFKDDIQNFQSDEKSIDQMDRLNLLKVFFFNRVFIEMFDIFSNKRSKFELIIGFEIVELIPIIFKLIMGKTFVFDKEIPIANQFEAIRKNIKGFTANINKFNDLDLNSKKSYLLLIFQSFLQLFATCTERIYPEEIYTKIRPLMEEPKILEKMSVLLQFNPGIMIFKQVLRVYNNFRIFSNNHLINNRQKYFKDDQNQRGEVSIGDSMFDIDMYNQIIKIGNDSIDYIIKHKDQKKEKFKYFTCAYFPLVFKLYSGIITLFIYEDYKSYVSKYKQICQMVDEFLNIINKFTKLCEERQINLKLNKKRRFLAKYKNIDKINQFMKNFKESIDDKDNLYFYDDASESEFYLLRKKGYGLLSQIIKLYFNHFDYKLYHIKKFVRFDAKNTQSFIKMTMDKTLVFNSLYREKNINNFNRNMENQFDQFKTPLKVRKFFIHFYKVKKTYYFEKPSENQCFIIFKTSDILKNNIKMYIEYFYNQIDKMDLDFKKENIKQCIFYNKNYISMLLMMDNLIRNSSQYRQTFFDFFPPVEKKNIEQKYLKSFDKIWKMHKILFDFALFKPFIDKDWSELYTLYYLLSNFIQNLCEDNSVYFKNWFREQQSQNQSQSLFMYYFQQFELAFTNSKIHKNKTNWISLSDKQEQFLMLNRIIEGVTEFINGDALKNQKQVYKYKINIWVGIILRRVIDPDSNFYQLKWHVLNYILGLTEGLNFEVINFLATNFPVSKLYDHLIFLIKMLYIKQQIKGTSQTKITKKMLNSLKIENTDQILNFYQLYDKDFSDHMVLNVAVKIYHLMRDISTNIVRYENFILEQTENVKLKNRNQLTDDKDITSACIWEFLNKIIVDVEISLKTDINEDNVKSLEKLRLFYFKKLPSCFFLTDSAKKHFMDYVNIDSRDQKHEQFFDNINKFKIQIEDQQKLYIKSRFLFKLSTEKSFYYYKIILYLIALAINVMFLVFYNEADRDFSNNRGNADFPIFILALVSAVISGFFLVFWFTIKYPTIQKMNWENYYIINTRNKTPTLQQRLYINFVESILLNPNFQSFFFHFIFTILGNVTSPFFYTLLLLLIVHLNILVYNVVLSFLVNTDKLFFTMIIILVVINSFSYILAENYRNQFEGDDIGDQNLIMCDTYFRCFINTINLGLRGGGGISDYMSLRGDENSAGFAGRFFFDLFFFIIVNLILLGIFFGIIVDSFGEFRDKMTKRQKDTKNICFTCGLDKPSLEKKGIDFEEHKKFHDIWNYFYYVVYLKWKPQNYFDGVDIHVDELIQDNYKNDWLPCMLTEKYDKNNN